MSVPGGAQQILAYPWSPALTDVGDYVTARTLDMATPGSDTPTGTFTASTYPTGDQVGRLVDAASAWLAATVGTVVEGLYPMATAVAAMRAAGLVELSYPLRDADVNTAAALLAQADAGLLKLKDANQYVTGVEATAASALLPVWSAPAPLFWGDREPPL